MKFRFILLLAICLVFGSIFLFVSKFRQQAHGQIYIYSNSNGQSSSTGGVISLASTGEPSISVGGYQISGNAKVDLYKSNDDAVLDYLTHDSKGQQIQKTPDPSKITFIKTFYQQINTSNNSQSKILLPLDNTGIWYVKININGINTDAFVVRSNLGVLAKEGNNEIIFWGQDYKTKRSITNAQVILYNLENSRKELQRVNFDNNGIAHTNISSDIDVALIAQSDDRAIVPINLKYLNTGYSYTSFASKTQNSKYFIFTDRPLYKPGDTVYFKAIIRDDDDAVYSIPTGNATVKITSDFQANNTLYEKSIPVSADGTLDGQFQLPSDINVGYYYLTITLDQQDNSSTYYDGDYSSNYVSFDVEYYKKPQSYITLTIPKTEYISGDKTSFTINGTYFSGQPLIGQKVKYLITSASYYEYEYLQDQKNLSGNFLNNFWYSSPYSYGESQKVLEGTAVLNNRGEATIQLDTKLKGNDGKSQIFTIEATLDDGSQEPPYADKNIIVYAGEYGIYRKDSDYSSNVGTQINLPISLVAYRNGKVSSIGLTAKIHRENWIITYDPNQKYPSYKKEEEDLPSVTGTTDSSGNTTISFTPTKVGSYTITVQGQDGIGNTISKAFYSYVSSEDTSYTVNGQTNNISVVADKQSYLPTDTAHLTIYSSIADRDIFLSLERARVDGFQVVHLSGKTAKVDIPLKDTDIPDMFAVVSSFSSSDLDSGNTQLHVSPNEKRLLINVFPDSKKYGPGDTVNVKIQTKDYTGNPVSAEVTFWSVDKALYELSDSKLGDIFDTFWHERYNYTQTAHSLQAIQTYQPGGGGGCFAPGTKILMANGSTKNIEDVKVGDYVLTSSTGALHKIKARVTKIYSAIDPGYLIINGNLKITPDHILFVNNSWIQAGDISIGDKLTFSDGKIFPVSSIEWQAGKFKVYNLEVENYHTFFANGIWVHNQKGLSRTVFKDVAYWNPSIHTDSSGNANVSFVLPDNLTTWTLVAVGDTQDTKVGQTTIDIVETKDYIVRPILPNILRVGDEAVISALVENFTNSDSNFNIKLSFDSGSIESKNFNNYLVKSNSIEQVYWKIKATKENPNAKIVFSATPVNDKNKGDIVTEQIPIRSFAFSEKTAQTGEGTKDFNVSLNSDSDRSKSSVTLSLSPTLVGILPTAMDYLINYPYGCVEQTTSRFVPAVIAKTNPDLFANSLKDKNIDNIIQKGIENLSSLQEGDGGWPWWFSGRSDPFVTAYVVEYLVAAKNAGAKVDDSILTNAENFLKTNTYYDYSLGKEINYSMEDKIAKMYGLAILGDKNSTLLSDNTNLSPDILALEVMTNYLSGFTDPTINGLNRLTQMAVSQGDSVFWQQGTKQNFGSIDGSTALAVRAMLLAGGDKTLIQKAVRYLSQSRSYDYWTNTFATSQVIRALTDFAKTNNELTPKYSYSISSNNKSITSGDVNSSSQEINDVKIPIKSDNFNVLVTKNGSGNLYETLIVNQLRTDKNAKALDHGLYVKREYVNEKGAQYSLGVGDTAIVMITVGGLKSSDNYAVIEDQLPAGMVPINENFNNSSFDKTADQYYTNFGVSDTQVTENGMILSLYNIKAGEQTYTYRARVVSEGTFIVPPVTASLMYEPEIYGRSGVQTLSIAKESKVVKNITKAPSQNLTAKYIIFTISLVVLIFIYGILVSKEKPFIKTILVKISSFIHKNPSN